MSKPNQIKVVRRCDMWEYKHTDELYHYGVLGMKWGRRKARSKNGKSIFSRKKDKPDTRSEDSKNVAQIRKKKVSQMTNKELREANDRLELERRYVDLSSKRATGQKIVQTFIATGLTLGTIEVAAKNYKKVGDFVINKLGKRVVK